MRAEITALDYYEFRQLNVPLFVNRPRIVNTIPVDTLDVDLFEKREDIRRRELAVWLLHTWEEEKERVERKKKSSTTLQNKL